MKIMMTCPKGHRFNRMRFKTCPFCKLLWGQREKPEALPVYAAPPFPRDRDDRETSDTRPERMAEVYAAPPFPKGNPIIKLRRRNQPPIDSVYNGPDIPYEETESKKPETEDNNSIDITSESLGKTESGEDKPE